ncbi:hypothetical protein D3C72_1913640 [compost metagenome]
MITFVNNCQTPTFKCCHPFWVAPPHQRYFAQYIAVEAQLDQEGVLAHDREQGFADRVVGQVRRFIVFHAWQNLGIDINQVVRQPNAGFLLNRTFKALLQPQHPTVIPVHGNGHAIANDRRRDHPG